jgi:hypothetical protein
MNMNHNIYSRIKSILETARTNVSRTVNTTQVIANWLIGREIVEEDQQGKKSAVYGKQEVEELSNKLQKEFGSGYLVQNLFYMRQFYLIYPELIDLNEILHAVRGELIVNKKTRHTPGKIGKLTHCDLGQLKLYINYMTVRNKIWKKLRCLKNYLKIIFILGDRLNLLI